jgi:hypothetical protein
MGEGGMLQRAVGAPTEMAVGVTSKGGGEMGWAKVHSAMSGVWN